MIISSMMKYFFKKLTMYKRKILVGVVLIIASLGLYFTYVFYRVFFLSNTAFANEKSYVFIATGTTMSDLIIDLSPLLKSTEDFRLAADKKGYSSRIKAGKFALDNGMSNNDIINRLRSNPLPIRVTFNNQERLEDLAGKIANQIEADSLSLINQFYNKAFLAAQGFTPENALAMYLPNTYSFFWNTSAEEFQIRMLKEYNRFWTNERLEAAEKVGLAQTEVIALASVVQKESVKSDERARIAGVYLNRLKRNIRLQADPTVIYAMKKNTQNFDLVIKRVLYKDLLLDSPYNTYKYRGLPPGPITMPDVSSIDAVLFPEAHSYLYFVADINRMGYHKFARTLKEHNQNRISYVRWLNKQKLYR